MEKTTNDTESKGWVVIETADTRVGLTPERLALLGEPFEQAADTLRRGRLGLGIGWAFVRYVAELHGGWTRVQSSGPDQGSTFSLALPHIAGWHEVSLTVETDELNKEGVQRREFVKQENHGRIMAARWGSHWYLWGLV